jgi:hypothetical protein
MNMNGKKKAPTALEFYVAHLIQEKQDAGDDIRAIGKALGMAHSTASQICNHLKGIGIDKQRELAKALTGGSTDRLMSAAEKWRRANPNWFPRAYLENHPVGEKVPLRSSWAWWPAAAEEAAKKKQHLAWAIWAAGNEPRGNEPRLEKRTWRYVLSLAEKMLDLPDNVQGSLENEYRRSGSSQERYPSGSPIAMKQRS